MKLTPARAFAPALVVLALALGAGCSSGGDSADSGSTSDVAAGGSAQDAPEAAAPSPADGMFSVADAGPHDRWRTPRSRTSSSVR